MALSFDNIQARLAAHDARVIAGDDGTRFAAVACVLRWRQEPEVLLIRRTEQPGDPWSGQMAFPGGRMEPEDPDALATAIRETHEEVGLALEPAHHLGRLDDLQAIGKGLRLNLVIVPHVFRVAPTVEVGTSDEVAATVWTPLSAMHSGSSQTTIPWKIRGEMIDMPGYAVGDRVVWGLTYRMLQMFFEVIDPARMRP